MRARRVGPGAWSASLLVLLVVAGCSHAAAPSPTPDATPPPVVTSSPPTTSAVPTTSSSALPPAGAPTDPLTGGHPSANPVIAVKIDNTYFEVPQFGVSDADVVYVEQVEGGLTRLIAVFHTTFPTEVGPVRSVRSTDSQLLTVYGKPVLVFSGGADGPLGMLAATPIINGSDLDVYWRSDVATGTYNLHADLQKVAAQAKNLGAGTPGPVGFSFAAKDARVAAGKPATDLRVVMQAGETDFVYSGGHYVRHRDGEPLSDYQGKPELADNVLVQSVTDEPDGTVDTNGAPSMLSHTIGTGEVTLYRDGRAIAGTWTRTAADQPFQFLDDKGEPLPFKPGRTWVLLAPPQTTVTVS